MAGMVKITIFILLVFSLFAGNLNALVLTGNVDRIAEINNEGNLKELINSMEPNAKYALLIGTDGTAALITSRSFNEIQIKKDNMTWSSTTETLSAVCNIRNLKEICIYSRKTDKNHFSDRLEDFEFIGQSRKNGYYTRKYKENIEE